MEKDGVDRQLSMNTQTIGNGIQIQPVQLDPLQENLVELVYPCV